MNKSRVILVSLSIIVLFSFSMPTAMANMTMGNERFDGPAALDNYDFQSSLTTGDWIVESGSPSFDGDVARHGRSLKMSADSGQLKVRQDLDSTPIYQITKFRGDSSGSVWIEFSFFFHNQDSEKAAASIQTRRGLSNWLPPVTSTFAEGPEASGELAWTQASVRAQVYADTTAIRVWMIGDQSVSGFRNVWFDDAELTISDLSTTSSTYGKVALATSIYDVRYQPGTYNQYYEVTFGVATATERYGSYYPYRVTMRIEMEPNYPVLWWRATTQDGDVNVVRIGEVIAGGNPAKPRIASDAHEHGAFIAAIALDGLKDGFCALGTGATLGVGILAGAVINVILDFYKEQTNAYDCNADGGDDWGTQVIWDYWQSSGGVGNPKLPTITSNTHEVTWIFQKGHPDYRIRLTTQVDWCYLGLTTYGLTMYHAGTTFTADYLTAP